MSGLRSNFFVNTKLDSCKNATFSEMKLKGHGIKGCKPLSFVIEYVWFALVKVKMLNTLGKYKTEKDRNK